MVKKEETLRSQVQLFLLYELKSIPEEQDELSKDPMQVSRIQVHQSVLNNPTLLVISFWFYIVGIVDLQCCVSFRGIVKWLSYTHSYISILFQILFPYKLLPLS